MRQEEHNGNIHTFDDTGKLAYVVSKVLVDKVAVEAIPAKKQAKKRKSVKSDGSKNHA